MQANCTYQAQGQNIALNCPDMAVNSVGSIFDPIINSLHFIPWIIGLFLIYLIARSGFYVVKQQSRTIIERLGKFYLSAEPGLHFKIPIIDRIVTTMWLRIEQLALVVETKTKDNVFVKVHVAVQNRVIAEHASDAWYQLENENEQVSSYVFDIVRAQIPTMELDHVFEKKDDIANAVMQTLQEQMQRFGYEIISVLVTDIEPEADVKAAMNEIQTQQRLQIAAQAKGEANKILAIKNAEAEAESKRLQGVGIASQRTAIATGLKEAVKMVAEASGVDPKEVLMTVMLTQYLDTMKEIGVSAGSKVILLPHSPSGMADVSEQIRHAIITGAEASK